MLILKPENPLFNYFQCKKLYEENQKFLDDDTNFDDLISDSDIHFYSFFEHSRFIGCIYFYINNNKVFLNAFAKRHTHNINLECLKASLNFYNCDIYAKSKHKTAILCLLKCGFKKVKDNLYKYER